MNDGRIAIRLKCVRVRALTRGGRNICSTLTKATRDLSRRVRVRVWVWVWVWAWVRVRGTPCLCLSLSRSFFPTPPPHPRATSWSISSSSSRSFETSLASFFFSLKSRYYSSGQTSSRFLLAIIERRQGDGKTSLSRGRPRSHRRAIPRPSTQQRPRGLVHRPTARISLSQLLLRGSQFTIRTVHN
jgi:hypothetical protein